MTWQARAAVGYRLDRLRSVRHELVATLQRLTGGGDASDAHVHSTVQTSRGLRSNMHAESRLNYRFQARADWHVT